MQLRVKLVSPGIGTSRCVSQNSKSDVWKESNTPGEQLDGLSTVPILVYEALSHNYQWTGQPPYHTGNCKVCLNGSGLEPGCEKFWDRAVCSCTELERGDSGRGGLV